MKTLKIIIVLFSISVLFATCKKDSSPDCIQGNGSQVQESRTVSNFNGIVANGAFDLSISQISNTGVDLFGDSNVLPIITTAVNNNVLTISTQNDQCYSTSKNIEVTITTPEIYSVALNGAGKIDAYNLNTDVLLFETNGSATISSSFDVKRLQTIINGSGNANFSGTADLANFSISGTGSILASTVETDSCEISITGVGDVRISVNKYLEVTISGSGNVYYSGDPETIKQYITGTGQLIKEG
jgi:hypothetical protein